jgi:LysM repeat protein
MRYLLIFTTPLFFWGCGEQIAALQNQRNYDAVVEELRTEIADLKHQLHATDVEMRLLEERLDTAHASPDLSKDLASLQRKISHLERSQEKAASEIQALTNHANQTSASFSQYRDRIQELDQRVSETNKVKQVTTSSNMTYKVKAGDSLEKIARQNHTSVAVLKKLNHLESDRIHVGQELIVSHE